MGACISLAADSPRLALVIGNAYYEHAVFPALSNPLHDARDVARMLEEFCFEVILEENADRDSMLVAIEEFGQRLSKNGGLGLFYYSGHGLQHQQQQYLIPLRSALFDEEELPIKGIHADTIVQQMELAGNAHNIIIFDSCREGFRQENFDRSGRKDFVAMQGPPDSVIVFSSALGQSAFGDSGSRNSLYTRHLVQALRKNEGQDLLDILRAVNRRVTEEAVFYRLNAQSLHMLQQKGLPEELLRSLQRPQLSQADFTRLQFEGSLRKLLSPAHYAQYLPLIRSSAEHSQVPWLYTNIIDDIVLSDSCPLAPGGRPPLSADILSFPETDELVLSSTPTPIEFMAMLNRDANDASYAWSLNSDVGYFEGDPTSSRLRYIPPTQIDADMTGVSIVLTVRQGEETIRQEKRLTLLVNPQTENLNLKKKNGVSSSSSTAWKWIAGAGSLAGAAATAAIVNNSGNDSTASSFRTYSHSGTFDYSGSISPKDVSISCTEGDIEPIVQIRLGLIEGSEGLYGFRRNSVTFAACCSETVENTLSGGFIISGENTIALVWLPPFEIECECRDGENSCSYKEQLGMSHYSLNDNGSILIGKDGDDDGRQFQRVQ